jgi:hypothetical protein
MIATIDEALELLEDSGPEFGNGLSNHGPMAAEALVTLGRSGAIVPWVERYKRRLQAKPTGRNRIDPSEWKEALGDFSRVADWGTFFERELTERPWRQVVGEWVPVLAPGLIAAAMHGIIRTAHAARSLEGDETPLRLQELAQGLGYWAARFQELPSKPVEPGSLSPRQALTEVRLVPERKRQSGTLILHGLRPLEDDRHFPDVANLVDTSGDVSAFLSELTATFAAVYLAHADRIGQIITFIHTVTGQAAIRILLPYLPTGAAPMVLRYGWQADAALYSALASDRTEPISDTSVDNEDLIDRAVASGDEHAIKFAEACIREHAISPHPVYLVAATDAAQKLTRG